MTNIFGYSWEQIQHAQQGGRLATAVDVRAVAAPDASLADVALLQEHGEAGLRELGFHGVLDRLARAGKL